MKKVLKTLCVGMSLVALLSLMGCDNSNNGSNTDVGASITNHQTDNREEQSNQNTNSSWWVLLNGKKISLPCTLADLAEANVHLYLDFDKDMILNSTNEEFFTVAMTYGDTFETLHARIETGSEPEKKEENAVVRAITNNHVGGELFELPGGAKLNDSLDDVLAALGDDYVVSGCTNDDIHQGYTVIHYGVKTNGIMLTFNNGVLSNIEVVAYREGE